MKLNKLNVGEETVVRAEPIANVQLKLEGSETVGDLKRKLSNLQVQLDRIDPNWNTTYEFKKGQGGSLIGVTLTFKPQEPA